MLQSIGDHVVADAEAGSTPFLVHREVGVYSDPRPEGYRSRAIFAEGQPVPIVIDGQQIAEVAIADILPLQQVRSKAEGNGA